MQWWCLMPSMLIFKIKIKSEEKNGKLNFGNCNFLKDSSLPLSYTHAHGSTFRFWYFYILACAKIYTHKTYRELERGTVWWVFFVLPARCFFITFCSVLTTELVYLFECEMSSKPAYPSFALCVQTSQILQLYAVVTAIKCRHGQKAIVWGIVWWPY